MFKRVCAQKGALPFVVSEGAEVENVRISPDGNTFDFKADGLELEGVRTKLIGGYQVKNAALALSAISRVRNILTGITADKIFVGMNNAAWPGRLEIVGKNPVVILDGGHNFDGVANLCRSINELWPGKSIGIVYAAMRDKDYSGCLELLSRELEPKLYVTTIPGMTRAAKPQELLSAAQKLAFKNEPESFSLPEEAVNKAVKDENDLVIICGSLYLVGYIRKNYRCII